MTSNGGSKDDKIIRILFIEDNPADYRLCVLEFKKAGMEIESDLVSTKKQFKERLAATSYEAIVTDYALNGWTALDALAILQREEQNIPMVLRTAEWPTHPAPSI